MRIYLGAGRFTVNASLERVNFHTAWVRLFNGECIKRYKNTRGFVDYEGDKKSEGFTLAKLKEAKRIFDANNKVSFWNRLGLILKRIWATLVCPIGSDNRGPKE